MGRQTGHTWSITRVLNQGIPYSRYFSGGKIFVAFVVERQTTKFLPMKQYRIVPGCGLVYHNHVNFSTNWPKIYCS